MAKPHLEIERRWLLKKLPDYEIRQAPNSTYIHYTSVYIYFYENLETRIQRRVNHRGPYPQWHPDIKPEITYPVVTKIGKGLSRLESPKLLADESLFRFYFDQKEFPRVSVDLWEIPFPQRKGKKWEIKQPNWVTNPVELGFDQYNNIVFVELEFDDVDKAKAFSDFPDWMEIEKEVTDDPRYNVRSLAVDGIPNPR